MIDVGRLGEMMRRSYVTVNQKSGASQLAQTMGNDTLIGQENIVQKRRKKKILTSLDSAKNGVARNSGQTKEELFT